MAGDRNKTETAIFVAHDDYNKRDEAESEKNLMRAILQSAMEDIRKKGEAHRDARRYFSSKDDFYLYSFLSVCYHLDLCPRTIQTVIGLQENRDQVDATSLNADADEKAAA